MTNVGKKLEGILRQKLHVFRCGCVGKAHGLHHIFSDNDAAIAVKRGTCDFLTRKLCQLLFRFHSDLICQRHIRHNDDT